MIKNDLRLLADSRRGSCAIFCEASRFEVQRLRAVIKDKQSDFKEKANDLVQSVKTEFAVAADNFKGKVLRGTSDAGRGGRLVP